MEPAVILHHHHVVCTACREGIVKTILEAREPLSEREIRQRLQEQFDRTTFYRSFKVLEENQILHKIVVDSQSVKYAIPENMDTQPDHAHFYCTECEAVRCLDEVRVSTKGLPEGYTVSEIQMIIKGRCDACQSGHT